MQTKKEIKKHVGNGDW